MFVSFAEFACQKVGALFVRHQNICLQSGQSDMVQMLQQRNEQLNLGTFFIHFMYYLRSLCIFYARLSVYKLFSLHNSVLL